MGVCLSDLVLEPFGGLAGDMWLGLLLDLGVQEVELREGLSSLGLSGWSLRVSEVQRRHLGCTRAVLTVDEESSHRHLPEILTLIGGSGLPEPVRGVASEIFRRLAEAEGCVHRISPDAVHFHEVGAADAILDVCGAALGLHLLGVESVWTSALPGGTGTVHCAHGELPVPVPAVVSLLSAPFVLQLGAGEGEMVTPTGAAILATVGAPLPPIAPVRVLRSGYGAGARARSIVRGSLVERLGGEVDDVSEDEITVLETWVDDGHPEQLAFLADALRAAGALEVGTTPIGTKHGRVGVHLTVLCAHADANVLAARMFSESPTLGIRWRRERRWIRERKQITVQTDWGPIRVKISGEVMAPEYADCAAAARAHGVALHRVYDAARDAVPQGLGSVHSK